MHKSKIHNNIIIILFSIILAIIILFGSMNIIIFDKDFYYREYTKNDVYSKISTNNQNNNTAVDIAHNATINIIDYFHDDAELKYFTNDEKKHMADVKILINLMTTIYYAAVVLSIILFVYCYVAFKKDKFMFVKIITRAILYSSIFLIISLLIIFLLSVFYFELLFVLFHLILFPQGNWTFDSTSFLITLFPQQFFFDITLRIFVYALFQAALFFGIGWWINKHLKIHEKHHI